jgi:hypothetical protein
MARFGKFFGRLFSDAGGYAIGGATQDALRPALQEVVNVANESHPAVPLTPSTAAQAQIAGGYSAKDAERDAAYNGLSRSRFDAIRSFAGNAPGVNQLLMLWNRRELTEKEVDAGLRQNLTRPEWSDALKALRWQLPSGQELAQMAVQGVLERDEAAALALLVGTNAATFDRLYRLAGDPIAPDELLTLWNRGELAEADVDRGLRQSRLKPEWVAAFKRLRHVLPPVSDVTRFAVREVYDPAARKSLDLDADFPEPFAREAAKVGLDEQTARDYWAAHWQLPSYTQATEMLFRGEITRPQFDGLLKALDYAPTWREKLAAIAQRIPPIGDMIRFAQREVYDPAQRRELGLDADYPAAFTDEAALHGMNEERARQYWAAHWRLPSALQGYRMLWRGEMNEGELDGLLKALDYPKLWRDRLRNIAYLVPGRIDLKRMYAAGILTRAEVHAGYRKLGYTERDADRMTELAVAGTGTTTKDLTAAQLASEYQGHFIDRTAYLERLAELGYSADEAEQLAGLADAKRIARARDQFIARIHAQFVGHKVDAQTARSALADAKIAAPAIELLMDEWTHEQTVNVRRLTQAQVVKAYKKARLTDVEARDALTDQGLSDAEADVLLDIA